MPKRKQEENPAMGPYIGKNMNGSERREKIISWSRYVIAVIITYDVCEFKTYILLISVYSQVSYIS